jgi:hypothetical protein
MQWFILALILSQHFSFAQDQAQSSTSNQLSSQEEISCESSGYYILDELKRANKSGTLSSSLIRRAPFATSKFNIKRSCIKAAQQQVTAGHKDKTGFVRANDFVSCAPDRSSMKSNLMTPCQTQETVTLTHNAFEIVTQCLSGFVSDSTDPSVQKKWIQTYFKLLSKESGFQNHVRSKSRPDPAIGIGQINRIYIEDFNKFAKEQVQDYLKNSPESSCQTLERKVFEKPLNGRNAACNYIGYDEDQILRNLVVSFSNIKIYRDRIKTFLRRNQSKQNLSDTEVKKSEHFLLAWAYNGGSGNIEDWITKGLASSNKKVQSSEQLYHLVFNKIDKPEAAKYLKNINKRMADVLSAAQEQSCWTK